MSVLNRKMFANRDARRKLANMGGILASSEELLGTAQSFAPGGRVSVEEYLVVIPGITNGPERMSANTLAYLQEAAPNLMANATIMDRETAADQGFDISRLRPADITAVKRLRESRPDMGVTSATMPSPTMDASVAYGSSPDRTVPRPPGGVTPSANYVLSNTDEQSFDLNSTVPVTSYSPRSNVPTPAVKTGVTSLNVPDPTEELSFGKRVGNAMRGIFQPIGDKAREIGQPIGDELRSVGQPIGEELRSVGQPIGDELRDLAETMGLRPPGVTTSDDALEAAKVRAQDENLTGREKAAISLEALLAKNAPGLDVVGLESQLLPPEVTSEPTAMEVIKEGSSFNYGDFLAARSMGKPILMSDYVASVDNLTDQQAADVRAMIDDPTYMPGEDEVAAATAPGLTPPPPMEDGLITYNDPPAMQGITDYIAGVAGGRTNQEQAIIDAERANREGQPNNIPLPAESGLGTRKGTNAQETAKEAAAANEQQQEEVAPQEDLTEQLSGIVADPDLTPNQKNNLTSGTIISGLTGKDASQMSTKERVTEYQNMFKELLGEDDQDAMEEKYLNLAMIGFAIAAGESPSALQNIANGLLEGSKVVKEDRATKRKREDAITTMAIEEVLGRDKEERAFNREKILAGIRAASSSGSFNTEDRMFKSVLDSVMESNKLKVEDGLMTPQESVDAAIAAASQAFPTSSFAIKVPDKETGGDIAAHKKANDTAKAAGQSTYVGPDGKTYKVQ